MTVLHRRIKLVRNNENVNFFFTALRSEVLYTDSFTGKFLFEDLLTSE